MYRLPNNHGIGIYAGCVDCRTPLCVDIYRYGEEMARSFLDGLPDLDVQAYSPDDVDGRAAIPFLEPEHLVDALIEELGQESGEDAISLGDLKRHYMFEVRRALQDAIRKTLSDYGEWTRKGDADG